MRGRERYGRDLQRVGHRERDGGRERLKGWRDRQTELWERAF